MSLSGLAIAIGMIVDGTIVVVENSFRLLHDNPKLSRAEVIAEATAEVAKPVLFALLIIAVVFIPLLSLEGLAGKLYSPMAIDIVFVMLGVTGSCPAFGTCTLLYAAQAGKTLQLSINECH